MNTVADATGTDEECGAGSSGELAGALLHSVSTVTLEELRRQSAQLRIDSAIVREQSRAARAWARQLRMRGTAACCDDSGG